MSNFRCFCFLMNGGNVPLHTARCVKARIEHEHRQNHECDEEGRPDFSVCVECKDHASFCSVCHLSNCCSAGNFAFDEDQGQEA